MEGALLRKVARILEFTSTNYPTEYLKRNALVLILRNDYTLFAYALRTEKKCFAKGISFFGILKFEQYRALPERLRSPRWTLTLSSPIVCNEEGVCHDHDGIDDLNKKNGI